MRLELVQNWMSREVITVTPETLLPDANQLMVGKLIRRLPVLENGRLVGIVTYGDLRDARPSRVASLTFWEVNDLAAHLTVGEIMTLNPVTIAPTATIGQAAQLMLKYMIGGLPVVEEDERLVGIITESDIFRLVVRDWMRVQDEKVEPYAHYK
jgi:acetoin utilization protein AcuB